MKRSRSIFSLAIFFSLLLVYPSFAEEKQKPVVGRYQLVAAQYEDSNGNAHPVVYRIDTMTGKTTFVIYVVAPGVSEENKVRGFAFEEVFESNFAFDSAMVKMKEYFKSK